MAFPVSHWCCVWIHSPFRLQGRVNEDCVVSKSCSFPFFHYLNRQSKCPPLGKNRGCATISQRGQRARAYLPRPASSGMAMTATTDKVCPATGYLCRQRYGHLPPLSAPPDRGLPIPMSKFGPHLAGRVWINSHTFTEVRRPPADKTRAVYATDGVEHRIDRGHRPAGHGIVLRWS